jgi:hypothetical protein
MILVSAVKRQLKSACTHHIKFGCYVSRWVPFIVSFEAGSVTNTRD